MFHASVPDSDSGMTGNQIRGKQNRINGQQRFTYCHCFTEVWLAEHLYLDYFTKSVPLLCL